MSYVFHDSLGFRTVLFNIILVTAKFSRDLSEFILAAGWLAELLWVNTSKQFLIKL